MELRPEHPSETFQDYFPYRPEVAQINGGPHLLVPPTLGTHAYGPTLETILATQVSQPTAAVEYRANGACYSPQAYRARARGRREPAARLGIRDLLVPHCNDPRQDECRPGL